MGFFISASYAEILPVATRHPSRQTQGNLLNSKITELWIIDLHRAMILECQRLTFQDSYMQVTEAADIIDEIILSLKRDPDQFKLSFSVIEQQLAASNGEGGINMTLSGDGVDSSVAGNGVNLANVTIELVREKGAQVFEEQFSFLLQDLREIADQLRSPSPDKLLIQEILASFRGSWIPGVIIGVVANAASKAIGPYTGG